MLSTQYGNLPTIIEFLYASLSAAEAVPDFTSLPLTKKNCIFRFGRDFVGFEMSPLICTDSKL